MPARRSTDSFFIRRSVALPADDSYVENVLDLGAFVDALGEAVLRIHNIAVTFTDHTGLALKVTNGQSAAVQYQLTTQSSSTMLKISDKSIIASGTVYASNAAGVANEYPILSHDADVAPQVWTNGYLVAVEQIYLAGTATPDWMKPGGGLATPYASIVLECTSERMTKAAGLALALSQQ